MNSNTKETRLPGGRDELRSPPRSEMALHLSVACATSSARCSARYSLAMMRISFGAMYESFAPLAHRSALTALIAACRARMAIAYEGDRLRVAITKTPFVMTLWLGQSGHPRTPWLAAFICTVSLSDHAQHLKLNRTTASNYCLVVQVVC